jgi:predicted DsbA family dithiol-disulfide isomerase
MGRPVTAPDPNADLPRLQVWVDPACPWAWQTSTWLRRLRDQGIFTIEWKLFSLELNASDPDIDFWEASKLHGEAHVGLALARREGGNEAFEALYVAIGERLHEQKEERSPQLFRKAAVDAGLADVIDRAVTDARLPHEIRGEHDAARDRSVFGVPTLSLDGSKAIYGPIIPSAPAGDEALEWWTHVRWLMDRPDFFELKRWPRDLRPGRPAPDAPT